MVQQCIKSRSSIIDVIGGVGDVTGPEVTKGLGAEKDSELEPTLESKRLFSGGSRAASVQFFLGLPGFRLVAGASGGGLLAGICCSELGEKSQSMLKRMQLPHTGFTSSH